MPYAPARSDRKLVVVIQNQVGDYYIISSTSATQCSTNKNTSSAKVGLYVFLSQRTKITAVVLFPGEIYGCTPTNTTFFHLGAW
jgi:hypothetical protein